MRVATNYMGNNPFFASSSRVTEWKSSSRSSIEQGSAPSESNLRFIWGISDPIDLPPVWRTQRNGV